MERGTNGGDRDDDKEKGEDEEDHRISQAANRRLLGDSGAATVTSACGGCGWMVLLHYQRDVALAVWLLCEPVSAVSL